MNLQEQFKSDCIDAVEFPKDSNLWHIPILRVKELLSEHFTSWETSNFQWSFLQSGHDLYCSGAVSLNLEIEKDGTIYFWTYVGSATFNAKKHDDQPDSNYNENYLGTLLSMCIKNASKNIGVFFGMNLNSTRPADYLPTHNEVKSDKPKSKNEIRKTINNILKTNS